MKYFFALNLSNLEGLSRTYVISSACRDRRLIDANLKGQ